MQFLMSDLKKTFEEDSYDALKTFVFRKAPHEYGSYEANLAHSIYNQESLIIMPEEDLIVPVIAFILNCPEHIWKIQKFPQSFLHKGSILFPISEVMGKEFAEIATGLFRYFGSLKVFDLLRSSYVLKDNTLIRIRRYSMY